MPSITRQQFLQSFAQGIDLKGPNSAQIDPAALERLRALDTNGDGLIRGQSALQKAWQILDGFDDNGNADSINGSGSAASILAKLSPASSVAPSQVSASTSERIAKAATDRAAADREGYAYPNAPTSPFRNLSGNKVPGESRPGWLQNNNKCNQFVGDALTQAGMKMPTYKMKDGTEHYVNAEKLPAQTKHFDRISDPSQIRPGDVFVLDYPGTGESTAHTEVITGFDEATGNMKTTGAHGDGAYERDRGAWLSEFSFDAQKKCWTNSAGHELFILRPKMHANAPAAPIRG